MKNIFLSVAAVLCAAGLFAQIGVGTTSPNSTLDVRGSLSTGYRTFTTSTSAALTLSQTVRLDASTTSVSLPVTAGSNFYEILSDGTAWRRINQVQ